MKRWVCSLVCLLLPLGAWAGAPVTIKHVVYQKGLWKYDEKSCAELRSDGGMMSKDNPCICEADISYVKLSGFPNAELFNRMIKDKAQRSTCDGKKVSDAVSSNGGDSRGFSAAVVQFGSLLQLGLSEGGYGYGAAHPYGEQEILLIDISTGKRLSNSDIFYSEKLPELNKYIYENAKDDRMDADNPEMLKNVEFVDVVREDQKNFYKNVISADQSRGNFYVSDGKLFIEIRVGYPSFYNTAIPLEFIRHPEIRKLYKEQPHA